MRIYQPHGTCIKSALCCDRRGRIWAAQQRHGVSVFNGEAWQTYDVLNGPLGERAFDIACCPLTGDIWIATCAGLVRYLEKPLFDEVESEHFIGDWEYVTRADGLPSDQVQALAIADDGTLYAGTQCDGLAIGLRTSSGFDWRIVKF